MRESVVSIGVQNETQTQLSLLMAYKIKIQNLINARGMVGVRSERVKWEDIDSVFRVKIGVILNLDRIDLVYFLNEAFD